MQFVVVLIKAVSNMKRENNHVNHYVIVFEEQLEKEGSMCG